MTDPQDARPTDVRAADAQAAKWHRTRRGRTIAGIAVVGCLALGAQALAESRPGQHLRLLVAEGGVSGIVPAQFGSAKLELAQFGSGHGFGRGRGPRSSFADMSEAEVNKMIARAVAHAAIEVEATDEQRDRITAIATELAGKARPVPQGFRDAGERMRELLLAKDVDAAAIEAVRAERIAEADRVSREVVTALVKVSKVLTPEQRATAAERIETFRSMRDRFRRRD